HTLHLHLRSVPTRRSSDLRPVLKRDVVVHPVTDRLHPGAAGSGPSEELPGHAHQLVGEAVAAGQREVQQLTRDLVDGKLRRGRGDRKSTRLNSSHGSTSYA